MTSKTQLTDI